MNQDALCDLVRRGPALAALRDEGPLDRHDLQARLDVSRPTVHRLTRALEDRNLVARTAEGCSLTALGETHRTRGVLRGFLRSTIDRW